MLQVMTLRAPGNPAKITGGEREALLESLLLDEPVLMFTPRDGRMFGGDRDEFNGCLLQRRVERLARRRDGVLIVHCVRLTEQYGKDGRGVDDQLGRPRSS